MHIHTNPLAKTTSEADLLLASMMRQAQMGIFALPDKTE